MVRFFYIELYPVFAIFVVANLYFILLLRHLRRKTDFPAFRLVALLTRNKRSRMRLLGTVSNVLVIPILPLFIYYIVTESGISFFILGQLIVATAVLTETRFIFAARTASELKLPPKASK